MKKSTIKMVLRNKIDSWIDSIGCDEKTKQVRSLIRRDVIVSGGAIASMLSGEQINDYDLYFRTKETALAVANYYVDLFNTPDYVKISKMKGARPAVRLDTRVNIKGETEERIIIFTQSQGVSGELPDDPDIEKCDIKDAEELCSMSRSDHYKKYKPVFFSENAISLSGKIQLVIRFYGTPQEIHNNYDYAHAMNYYDYANDELKLHPEALECLLSKRLIYHGSLYPIASLFRIRKFLERGWRISAGQILKIVFQLQGVDLSDPLVLREQLIGVDQAYMSDLLRQLESVKGRVDETYLANLIDRIFE